MTQTMRERLIAIISSSLPFDTLRLEEKLRDYDAPRLLDAILAELRVPDQAMTMASYYPDVPAVQRREIFTAMIDAVREGK